MKAFLAAVIALAFAFPARADVNYNLAKDQAKRAVNQSNAEQGIPPSYPQTPSAPGTPPADPALAATLQNITDLRADLTVLIQADDAQAGADQRAALMTHLSAAAAPGKKAATDSVKKLAGHLITAASGRKILAAQNAVLARDLHALFNRAHLSAVQQQTLLDSVKKILTDAGVPADDADNIISDLKQIAAETQ